MTITALRDLANVKTCAPLALPYYFFKEKMEFLGQSPSLGVFRPWGLAKRPAIIAGANFQEYVPFPISQDAGERTADLICNPGKKKVSSERIGEVAASRRTNRKTIRADIIKQTDSENQEKYNNCFCIIFPEKRK